MLAAVERHDWADVEDWCALGVDRRASQPPLHHLLARAPEVLVNPALIEGIDTLVGRLGQDVNRRSATGYSPLRTALLYAPPSAVQRLLELGADPNETVRHKDRPTALWLLFVEEGHRRWSEHKALILRNAGTRLDVQTVDGLTDQALLCRQRDKLPDNEQLIALEHTLNVLHEDQALRTMIEPSAPIGDRPRGRL